MPSALVLMQGSSSPSRGLPAPSILSRRRAGEQTDTRGHGPLPCVRAVLVLSRLEPEGCVPGRVCRPWAMRGARCVNVPAKPPARICDTTSLLSVQSGVRGPRFGRCGQKKCPLGGGLKLLSWRRIVETGALCLAPRYASNDHFRYRSSRFYITDAFGRVRWPLSVSTAPPVRRFVLQGDAVRLAIHQRLTLHELSSSPVCWKTTVLPVFALV